jgi:gamma-aminobutyric acid receptor subunit alpha
MTFLGLEARKDLPKVPYPTALDYFVFISFTYIFTTVVQFGLVHHFTKVVSTVQCMLVMEKPGVQCTVVFALIVT